MSTNVFIWQGKATGGAERITLAMAQYLHQQGHHVTLGMLVADPAINLPQMVVSVSSWIPSSFRSLVASLVWRWRYARQFQVVYAHTLGWWKIKNNFVFMHDAADLDAYHAQPASVWHALASWLWRQLYLQLSLRPATRIFSATTDFTAYLERHHLSPSKIIPSGSFYDDAVFKQATFNQPSKPYRLIFIGNPHDRRKNFAAVTSAFWQQFNYVVEVFGSKEQKQVHNFHYRGYVSPTELYQALIQAHIFVMPSLGEGFSIALLEALATGIPCVVNSAAVNPELRGFRNLITYENSHELQSAVEKVLANYEQYAQADPRVTQFTQAVILEREYRQIISVDSF